MHVVERGQGTYRGRFHVVSAGILALVLLVSGCSSPDLARPLPATTNAILVGYWHNWRGTATEYIRLRDVPAAYSRIIVAFALPDQANAGIMNFEPTRQTPASFMQDIRWKQARRTDIVLSIGGGRHPVILRSPQEVRAFVGSVSRIIDTYGFDGLDLNLEGDSLVLDPGDTDFRRPTTPRIVNMIQAVRLLMARYGPEFILSASPETVFVTGGYKQYGGIHGAYLPLLYGLRDHLDLVHMQFYNSGTQLVYEGPRPRHEELIVTRGTADFVVGLAEMLILGFPVGQDPRNRFPGFGANRIAIGLPATPSAASPHSYLPPDEFRRAMQYLVAGRRTYPSPYRLRQPGGHPGLAGVMTWSINWDASTDGGTHPYAFARSVITLWAGDR